MKYKILLCFLLLNKNLQSGHGHNMVHNAELNLKLSHMRKSWHLYVKQFAGFCLEKIAKDFKQMIPCLYLHMSCKMSIRERNCSQNKQQKHVTAILGQFNVSVTFVKHGQEVYFDKHPFRQWTFTLDKTLRLNLTFTFIKFSSSRNNICSLQNLTIFSSSAGIIDMFTFCKKLSEFHIFPRFSNTDIFMHTAEHKWQYHYFTYQFVLLYSVMDTDIFHNVMKSRANLSYLQWVLQTKHMSIYGNNIVVEKHQSIQIQVVDQDKSCVRVFDGPGTDAELVQRQTTVRKVFFFASSFQCVIQQIMSNICSQIDVTFAGKDLDISLSLNSETEFSFYSPDHTFPVLSNWSKLMVSTPTLVSRISILKEGFLTCVNLVQ